MGDRTPRDACLARDLLQGNGRISAGADTAKGRLKDPEPCCFAPVLLGTPVPVLRDLTQPASPGILLSHSYRLPGRAQSSRHKTNAFTGVVGHLFMNTIFETGDTHPLRTRHSIVFPRAPEKSARTIPVVSGAAQFRSKRDVLITRSSKVIGRCWIGWKIVLTQPDCCQSAIRRWLGSRASNAAQSIGWNKGRNHGKGAGWR